MKPQFLDLNIKNKAIHCNSCENRIMQVLGGSAGIINITADHTTQKVQLYFDKDAIKPSEIIGILKEIGFPPVDEE